jgi:3-hydroxyacyl-[acyl-carrier-protein] dehydratase
MRSNGQAFQPDCGEKEPRVTIEPSGPFLGLPHRPPFVFVRELVNCTPGILAEAATTFAADDPIFAGHFPDNPLVPGVILTEALAQTAGIAAASGYSGATKPLFLLSAIRSMKFFRAVRPGERVELRAERLAEVDDLVQFKVDAHVNGVRVAEGQLVLSVAANSAAGLE